MNFVRKILKSKKDKKKGKEKDVSVPKWSITSDTVIVLDIGNLYTKYGPTTANEPLTFPTLITESVQMHYGSYLQSPGREDIGFDALASRRSFQIKWDPVINWEEIEHFALYAVVKCYHPTEPISEELYVYNNPVLVLQPQLNSYDLADYFHGEKNWQSNYDNREKNIKSRPIIYPAGSKIVVDLGHSSIRFHVITADGKPVHSETLDIGGDVISYTLGQLVQANNLTWKSNTGFSTHLVKEKVSFVSTDLSKSLKEFGYQSDFLNHLAANKNSYLSLLPNDILTHIHQCHVNKFRKPEASILERLGCIQTSEKIKTEKIECSGEYEIGAERFLAMEVLFQPFMIKKKQSLQGALRALVEKYNEKNIVLQGGMSKCPGMKERLLLELKDLNVTITINEFYNWSNIKE